MVKFSTLAAQAVRNIILRLETKAVWLKRRLRPIFPWFRYSQRFGWLADIQHAEGKIRLSQ
ncbi:MAG: hypothetical protein ACJAR9_000828 [Celeribacter sp.]|jgi:hypothetical protein